jgi:sulfite reductase (ferredoxin)
MDKTRQDKQADSELPDSIQRELNEYGEWIKKHRANQIGEVKMQKIRLQLGTYAQRQEGVQMQRIKFPGGTISSDQLIKLADVAEKYAGGFIHFTTREDAQLYYIKLEECPDMMKDLASAKITTREACGNTIRNITACYQSGISATEVFDVTPYAHALFRFLLRNKFNQVMGRKFKIAFEGCADDHSGMRFHDFGFKAVVKKEGGLKRRGFRAYVGGGLGATPMLGILYSEFLPEQDLMNFAAATVRLFDRYGERKNRMAARMKFLVKKLGWEKFREELDRERKEVKLPSSVNDWIKDAHKERQALALPANLPPNPSGIESTPAYKEWVKDNVFKHKFPGYAGVNVRLKLGDILSEPARKLAEIARTLSHGELRISIHQNLVLSWVPEKSLPLLYQKLSELGLADAGAETLDDVTTCPGADTCRLGITSAKGLGSSISAAMKNGLSRYKELTKGIWVKISGCPNGCAQHGVANIGFQGAALSKDGKTVPAHELFLGGQMALDDTAFGERLGKFPARNCTKIVETLVELYSKEKGGSESFNQTLKRIGKDKILGILEPFTHIPSFEEDPEFYKDLGHENEKFAIRTGIKGECAGATVQEKAPVMQEAKEKLAQAEAFFAHKEFGNAVLEAYEAAAAAARVPLYAALVDPFTSEQALWEFENVFVRSGKASQEWLNSAEKFESAKKSEPSEPAAKSLIDLAKKYLLESEKIYSELFQQSTTTRPKPGRAEG